MTTFPFFLFYFIIYASTFHNFTIKYFEAQSSYSEVVFSVCSYLTFSNPQIDCSLFLLCCRVKDHSRYSAWTRAVLSRSNVILALVSSKFLTNCVKLHRIMSISRIMIIYHNPNDFYCR